MYISVYRYGSLQIWYNVNFCILHSTPHTKAVQPRWFHLLYYKKLNDNEEIFVGRWWESPVIALQNKTCFGQIRCVCPELCINNFSYVNLQWLTRTGIKICIAFVAPPTVHSVVYFRNWISYFCTVWLLQGKSRTLISDLGVVLHQKPRICR